MMIIATLFSSSFGLGSAPSSRPQRMRSWIDSDRLLGLAFDPRSVDVYTASSNIYYIYIYILIYVYIYILTLEYSGCFLLFSYGSYGVVKNPFITNLCLGFCIKDVKYILCRGRPANAAQCWQFTGAGIMR